MSLIAFLPLVFGAFSIVALGLAIWSFTWPRVKGTVDISIFTQDWDADASGSEIVVQKRGKLDLAYSYSIHGTAFQGSRVVPLFDVDWQLFNSPEFSRAHDLADRYREGAVVDVSYCPYFPQWACLEPGGFLAGILFGAFAAALYFIV